MNCKALRAFVSAALAGALLFSTTAVSTQERPQDRPAEAQAAPEGLGLDLFGGAGFSWPAAKDSFRAVDLSSTALDFGGGARLTGLPGRVFGQVAVAHWWDTGERAFVAEDGTSFPLGIPLEVTATFLDATIGLKYPARSSTGRTSSLYYL